MTEELSRDVVKTKTMRHMETVRNHLNAVIKELLSRSEQHDQSKLEPEEINGFTEYTGKLRGCTYGSEEYKEHLKGLKPSLDHHYKLNSHHPEHFENGIQDMTLLDVIEMICDWKSSTMRHANGDIFESIELNQKRFNYSDEMKQILINTAKWIESKEIYHKAEQS